MAILDDLAAEYERLEAILGGLDADAWTVGSGAPGWSVADVVVHLAQTEEAVLATLAGTDVPETWAARTGTLDSVMDQWVRAERAEPAVVLARWRAAQRAVLGALRAADPQRAVPWAAVPLKPAALATTRLAEHWAHGLDITARWGSRSPMSTASATLPGSRTGPCRTRSPRPASYRSRCSAS